ncbi:hypothetical protein VTL71DRAFT_9456 [Oculimacula yallundae]|uniref:Uncharacterized protein n=1 Tax=Oculimacula yallundae TaxID=86028 RepID=A0ABR4BTA0_9HELO
MQANKLDNGNGEPQDITGLVLVSTMWTISIGDSTPDGLQGDRFQTEGCSYYRDSHPTFRGQAQPSPSIPPSDRQVSTGNVTDACAISYKERCSALPDMHWKDFNDQAHCHLIWGFEIQINRKHYLRSTTSMAEAFIQLAPLQDVPTDIFTVIDPTHSLAQSPITRIQAHEPPWPPSAVCTPYSNPIPGCQFCKHGQCPHTSLCSPPPPASQVIDRVHAPITEDFLGSNARLSLHTSSGPISQLGVYSQTQSGNDTSLNETYSPGSLPPGSWNASTISNTTQRTLLARVPNSNYQEPALVDHSYHSEFINDSNSTGSSFREMVALGSWTAQPPPARVPNPNYQEPAFRDYDYHSQFSNGSTSTGSSARETVAQGSWITQPPPARAPIPNYQEPTTFE